MNLISLSLPQSSTVSSVHLFLILCSYTCGSSSLSFPLISSPPLPPKPTRTYRNMRPTHPSSRMWESARLPGRANGAVALCGALPLSLFPAPCGGRVMRARRRKEPLLSPPLSPSLLSQPLRVQPRCRHRRLRPRPSFLWRRRRRHRRSFSLIAQKQKGEDFNSAPPIG